MITAKEAKALYDESGAEAKALLNVFGIHLAVPLTKRGLRL